MAAVNEIADQLMGARHSDAATIAEWKDDLNEAWADLLELIDTRTQMLAASRELHKFFHDCKDVLGRIVEKQNTLSDELGRDAGSVSALQRKHQNFIQVILLIDKVILDDIFNDLLSCRIFKRYRVRSRVSRKIRNGSRRLTLETKLVRLLAVKERLSMPGFSCRPCARADVRNWPTQVTFSDSSPWYARSSSGLMTSSGK